jgi:hypothetical protein
LNISTSVNNPEKEIVILELEFEKAFDIVEHSTIITLL